MSGQYTWIFGKEAFILPLLTSTGTPMSSRKNILRIRRVIGGIGILIALPFFVWLPLGMLDSVPSMVDVFGISGLRIPASITVAGLLIAAIAFWEA